VGLDGVDACGRRAKAAGHVDASGWVGSHSGLISNGPPCSLFAAQLLLHRRLTKSSPGKKHALTPTGIRSPECTQMDREPGSMPPGQVERRVLGQSLGKPGAGHHRHAAWHLPFLHVRRAGVFCAARSRGRNHHA